MKKVLFLAISLLSVCILQAKVINVSDAKTLAQAYSIKSTQQLELAYTATAVQSTSVKVNDFYVFNKTGNSGFVIVAADDVVGNAILGYSDSGTFDYDKLPENAKAWLKGYQKEIEYLRANGKTAEMPSATAAPTIVVAPLLGNIMWDQSEPFNRQCPTVDGKNCVTGCGATALAMIMYYYKWPLQGKGTTSYRWNGQTLSADFSQSYYQWDKMLPVYANYTDEQANAVAKLMSDCGIALSMNYGVDGSGASVNKITSALKNYFRYKTSVKLISRLYYSTENWEKALIQELNERRPIQYNGWDEENNGHSFIVDGYDSNNYFHFNFGWSGTGNGYYVSAVAKDYPMSQDAVIGIEPQRTKSYADGLYYNILSDDGAEVEVTYPNSPDEYSGSITIPNSVVLNGKQYAVTSIGYNAFTGTKVENLTIPESVTFIATNSFTQCSKLKSLNISWATAPEINVSVFSNSVYSGTTLNVPAGKLDTYTEALPWQLFCKITDGTNTKEWTGWQANGNGIGTYKHSWYFDPSESSVVCRTLLTGDNAQQFKIDNWGYSSSLIINCNPATGECTIPMQTTGFAYSGEEIMISDYPTYSKGSTYKNSPCTFNPEIGKFSMYVSYYTKSGSTYSSRGIDEFLISGYPVYDIAIDTVYASAEGEMTAKLQFTDDVKKYAYILTSGTLSKGEVSNYVEKVKSGEITPEFATSKTLTKQLDSPDNYTLIVMSTNADGAYREYAYKVFAYESSKEPEWVAKYEGTYNYSVWEKVTQKNVIAYQDKNNPKNWKLSPMYENTEFYFYWNTATGVIEFSEQTTGFVYKKVDVTVAEYRSKSATAEPSYYNAEEKQLYFNTYYASGKFKENGFETYSILKDLNPQALLGDANGDGQINVNDITTIASYILEGTATPFVFENADVNKDAVINVNDITGTAAIILGD